MLQKRLTGTLFPSQIRGLYRLRRERWWSNWLWHPKKCDLRRNSNCFPLLPTQLSHHSHPVIELENRIMMNIDEPQLLDNIGRVYATNSAWHSAQNAHCQTHRVASTWMPSSLAKTRYRMVQDGTGWYRMVQVGHQGHGQWDCKWLPHVASESLLSPELKCQDPTDFQTCCQNL